jgi:phage terminase large subunit-like protein
LRFVTRTGGSGRGFSADMIVIDEAYNLTADSMAAVLPTMSARPNPQVWYTSSAGMVGSEQLARLRERGSKGDDPRLAYFEWSAPDDADLDDRQAWRQANPALGIRIRESFVESERLALPDEQFARERLGIWPTAAKRDAAIDPGLWKTLISPAPPWGQAITFSLDVAPDHSSATIAASWQVDAWTWVQSTETERRAGVEWVVPRWDELRARYGGRLLVEQTGTAAFLLPRLVDAEPVPRRFFVDGCSTLDAAVQARTMRHGNQPELNAAVSAARWSTSGEAGQRVLSRKNSQVSPLVAVALALHGQQTAPTTGGWMVSVR